MTQRRTDSAAHGENMERNLEALAALNAQAPPHGQILTHPARATVALALRMRHRLASPDAGVMVRREEVGGGGGRARRLGT